MQFYPYLPSTEALEAFWIAAAEKWSEKVEELGYIGRSGDHAYFQIREVVREAPASNRETGDVSA
ncbi:hypothetical protein [Salinibacter ruber]|uniref:hypothetical protein n=1 Tax=Salinibacter ruber TaxID=146919 RepID=UPI002169966A|nr:hypothetical protein [Salinibacter ruber]